MAATALRVADSAGAPLVSCEVRSKAAWFAVLPVTSAVGASGLAARLTETLADCAVAFDPDVLGAEDTAGIRSAEAIFLLSTVGRDSIQEATRHVQRLSASAGESVRDAIALVLLAGLPGGDPADRVTPAQAEEITGIPVCALLTDAEDVASFAAFLRAEHERIAAAVA